MNHMPSPNEGRFQTEYIPFIVRKKCTCLERHLKRFLCGNCGEGVEPQNVCYNRKFRCSTLYYTGKAEVKPHASDCPRSIQRARRTKQRKIRLEKKKVGK